MTVVPATVVDGVTVVVIVVAVVVIDESVDVSSVAEEQKVEVFHVSGFSVVP